MKRFAKWFVVPAIVAGAMVLGSTGTAQAARFSLFIGGGGYGGYGGGCAPSYQSYRAYRSYYPSYSVYSGYRPSYTYSYVTPYPSYRYGTHLFSGPIPFQAHHFHGRHH